MSLSSVMPGLPVGGRAFLEPDRPAVRPLIADLDRAGIAQRLADQQFGDLRRAAARFEIDGLHQRVRPLALICFGEAGHGAAHGRSRSGLVVAVLAAEARRGDQECARRRYLVVESAHGPVERLDPDVHGLAPGGEGHILEVALVVQGRQPIDAVDRAAPGASAGPTTSTCPAPAASQPALRPRRNGRA